MRLKTQKTWSQQELAVKLRVEKTERRQVLSREHWRLLIHAAKTALAAALCWWLALRFGLHDGYWGAISAIIVLQSNFGSTITASRDRFSARSLARCSDLLFALWHACRGTTFWLCLRRSSFAACWDCATARGWPESPSRSSCWCRSRARIGGSRWTAWAKSSWVSSWLCRVSTLVFPDRARLGFATDWRRSFFCLGAFFEVILQGFRGRPAENLATMRENWSSPRCASNNQLLGGIRATSLRAGRAGAKGSACSRSLAGRSLMCLWRWNLL